MENTKLSAGRSKESQVRLASKQEIRRSKIVAAKNKSKEVSREKFTRLMSVAFDLGIRKDMGFKNIEVMLREKTGMTSEQYIIFKPEILKNWSAYEVKKKEKKKEKCDKWVPDLTSASTGKRKIKKNEPVSVFVVIDANNDSFLQSYQWRELRMKAIKKHGARCQCCGSTPANGIVINVDHIKPRRKYPHLALDINNLQVLCNICNHGKGNWDETDWRGK